MLLRALVTSLTVLECHLCVDPCEPYNTRVAEDVEISRVASLWFTKCGLDLLFKWKIPLEFLLSTYKQSCIAARVCYGKLSLPTSRHPEESKLLTQCLIDFFSYLRGLRAFDYYRMNETWPQSDVESVRQFFSECAACAIHSNIELPNSSEVFVGVIRWIRSQII